MPYHVKGEVKHEIADRIESLLLKWHASKKESREKLMLILKETRDIKKFKRILEELLLLYDPNNPLNRNPPLEDLLAKLNQILEEIGLRAHYNDTWKVEYKEEE